MRGGDGPGQRLVEVVVRVDEAGQNEVAPRQIEHLVGGGGQFGGEADLFDNVFPHEQRPAAEFTPVGVHRDERMNIFDEQGRHGLR